MTAAAQLAFDFLIPARVRGKKLVTTTEAAWCIGRERDFVVALCDVGRLEVHRDSALGETNLSRRITMRSILLYLAATADYDAAPKAENLIAVIDTISDRAVLENLLQAVMRQRARL